MSSHSDSQVTKALLLGQAEQGNMGVKERPLLKQVLYCAQGQLI